MFLLTDQLRVADFDTQIAAGNHYRVGGANHVVQSVFAGDRLSTFDFRTDNAFAAGLAQELTRLVQIFATTRE